MLYGDQWVCACGWSNLFLRKRCRNCDEPQEKSKIGEQDWAEVVDNIYAKTPEQMERGERQATAAEKRAKRRRS